MNLVHIPLSLAVLAAAAILSSGAFAAEKQSSTPVASAPQQPASGQAAYGVKIGSFFNDQQKQAVRRAFSQEYAKAKECPPGLEKGKKGCESPWDTRYWAVGQALQPAVKAYPVPEPVVAQLPKPPQGYEYVRVADDILLISSGTKLVVDMIEKVAG
ncbi:MAG: RcnB family protein [Ramlibacter sp.]